MPQTVAHRNGQMPAVDFADKQQDPQQNAEKNITHQKMNRRDHSLSPPFIFDWIMSYISFRSESEIFSLDKRAESIGAAFPL